MQIAALVAEPLEVQIPIDLVPSVVVTATDPASQAEALLGVRISLSYSEIPNALRTMPVSLQMPSYGLFWFLLFTGSRDAKAPSFGLDKADIRNDMTGQRPIYPLSCYGPGREAPRQLIEGPVELCPEELRLRYYTLRTAGNEPTAVSLSKFIFKSSLT